MAGSDSAQAPNPSSPAIRVLLLTANPSEAARLAIGEEHRRIDRALRDSDGRDEVELRVAPEVRARELAQVLQRHRPTVVHFSGHGSEGGELLFADDHGRATPVGAAPLAAIFKVFARSLGLRCVVLNACYSEALAGVIGEHVDCVIGVPGAIGDVAAATYAGDLYGSLGYGRSVADAHELAQVTLRLAAGDLEALPQLHVRAGVDAAAVQLVTLTGGRGGPPGGEAAPRRDPGDGAGVSVVQNMGDVGAGASVTGVIIGGRR